MTADTSVAGAIGQAMGKAAHGAVLGHAIGKLKDEASEANDVAHQWRDYALKLEQKVARLEGAVESLASTATEKIEKVAELKLELLGLNEKYVKSEFNEKLNYDMVKANEAHGKQFKFRLRQMEKALQHSSADKEALRSILKVYEEVIERLNLTEELPDDMKKNAEVIWSKFMNGEDLTDDDDVQKIIDEAPVPKRESGTTF